MKKILLEDVFKKIVNFLNRERFEYILIGGIAAGILGEPRMTADIDVDIILEKDNIDKFLDKIKKCGFQFDKPKIIKRIKDIGTFQIKYGDFHIDFIISSTELEREAIRRKKVVKLYGLKTFIPTPEDFILLKIIPARHQDLADVQKVIIRHKKKLDVEYLKRWAQKISEEAEDLKIYNTLEKLLEKN